MDRCGVSGMNALKDILVDAARYRYLRSGKSDELSTVHHIDGGYEHYICQEDLDSKIDAELSRDE